jgi:hypothetical protein
LFSRRFNSSERTQADTSTNHYSDTESDSLTNNCAYPFTVSHSYTVTNCDFHTNTHANPFAKSISIHHAIANSFCNPNSDSNTYT